MFRRALRGFRVWRVRLTPVSLAARAAGARPCLFPTGVKRSLAACATVAPCLPDRGAAS